MAEETRRTIIIALGANLAVGVLKGIGGAISGSSSLLSEAAHSVADTFNEIFLLVSLGRSRKPADREHPFGYGKERFFWSLLAAVGIFVSGAGFSLYQGLTALFAPEKATSTRDFVVVYVVLAFTLVFEGGSLRTALRQVRGEARRARRSPRAYIQASADPTVKTVASEDSVAVVGVVIAFLGTLLHQLTGNEAWDATGSLLIAALLAFIAYRLGKGTKDLLIGVSADPLIRLTAYSVLHSSDEVEDVKEILTMQFGPEAVLVAARLSFKPHLTARELADVCTALAHEMHSKIPTLTEVFLDPSTVDDDERAHGAAMLRMTADELRQLEGPDAVERLRQEMHP